MLRPSSNALDPFNFDLDLDCTEPKPNAADAGAPSAPPAVPAPGG